MGINLKKVNVVYNADSWPIPALANFKVLQRINLDESFRHCYIHHKDYVMRCKKNSVEPF